MKKDEHRGKNLTNNQIFININCVFFTVCFFYREEKDREVEMKRRLKREKHLRRLCILFMDSLLSSPSSDIGKTVSREVNPDWMFRAFLSRERPFDDSHE